MSTGEYPHLQRIHLHRISHFIAMRDRANSSLPSQEVKFFINNGDLVEITPTGLHFSLAEIKLPSEASWDQNGVTVTGSSNGTAGSSLSQLNTPFGISITSSDILYISDSFNNRVVVIHPGSTINTFVIGSGPGANLTQFDHPYGLFATNTLLYVIDLFNHRLQNISLNGSNPSSVPSMTGLSWPYYLYVDNNDNIYLSDNSNHQVLLFRSNSTNSTIIAGTSIAGSNNSQLNGPFGVFVNHAGIMYIADCGNHRIMKWLQGASTGIVVAGNGTNGSSSTQLSRPTQIILDTNEYMYISEAENSRITRWRPNSTFGVCIAACTGTRGIASNQLNGPHSLAFDSNGSLYVSDRINHRVQKFQILRYQSPSYNRPKFDSCASWNPNAMTFANISTVGTQPYGVFVTISNTVYIAEYSLNQVQEWLEGSTIPTKNISGDLNETLSVFVTNNGDIYVDNGDNNYRVDKWTSNATSSIPAMYVSGHCYSLFVDMNGDLYCSLGDLNQIIKKSFNDGLNSTTTIAGNGSAGSASNMLNAPRQIVVDYNFSLYVADAHNDRIQFFQYGQINGTTLVGNGAIGTIALNFPIGIALDSDGYLFIADAYNNRIVRSGPSGYQCIIGCYGNGSAANQLNHPRLISFDSYGNLFVVDAYNNRIQKFFLSTNSCNSISYNQPKFSSCAHWNPNATTFANNSTVGTYPYHIFINTNNTVYVTASTINLVTIWLEGSIIPTRNLSAGLSYPRGLFVTSNGDVYVDNGNSNNRIDKWISNAPSSVAVTNVTSTCYSLFIDTNDTLYCSNVWQHKVIKVSLISGSNTPTIIAGNSTQGSGPYMLRSPNGIFVDSMFNLYVADCGNDRIQRFQPGILNGTTIVGNESIETLSLSCPTGVTLDAENYLFIVDYNNNRVIGSGPAGFRCIAGCSRSSGATADLLNNPRTLAFDSYGNMFVVDANNNRVQKFTLTTNSCMESSSMSLSTVLTSISNQNVQQASNYFIPSICSNTMTTGLKCNISSAPCDILKPCQNSGTCNNTNTTSSGYICLCSFGFTGTQCQHDYRPCKPNTCWNNGQCNETSSTTFVCSCVRGWDGINCETKINYCQNITCENNGICRPLFLGYLCECLGDSYSGRHCELVHTRIRIYEIISKSFAFIAITAVIIAAMFIIIMDVLKYWFHIDPAGKELERMRPKKQARKRKPPVIMRYIYVNAPLPQTTGNPISIIEETVV